MTSLAFYRYSCLIILFMVFLTPTIWIPGVIGVRFEEFFVMLWLVVFAIFYRQGVLEAAYIPVRGAMLLAFAAIILLSITVGSVMQLPASILDLTKFIWLFKALMVYFIFFMKNFARLSIHE